MQLGILILILFSLCACSQAPVRKIASIERDFYYSEVNVTESSIKLFPPETQSSFSRYFFYLELRNSLLQFVDIDPREIALMSGQGEQLDFSLERISRGRYYVTLEVAEDSLHSVDFLINSHYLKKNFRLTSHQPDQNHSSIITIAKSPYRHTLRLFLSDSQGRPIETISVPDLIIEGYAYAENMRSISPGIWEFDLAFPEQNGLFYISVRAQGKLLNRLFRLLHIEK
jgi:hypothetical protein